MSCPKRWCVGAWVMAAVLVVGTAWSQEEDQPAPQPQVKPGAPVKVRVKPAPRPRPVRFYSRTALDRVLAKLELTDEVKGKVAKALKAWRAKADEEAKQLAEKRKALREELAKLKGPTEVEQYQSAKATLADILPAEQLGKLDELAKAATLAYAVRFFEGQITGWEKKGVVLTDEQKATVAEKLAKVKEEGGKLDAGALRGPQSIAMKAAWSVRKEVLTDEQRAKIAVRRPRPKPKPKTPAPAPAPAPEGASGAE